MQVFAIFLSVSNYTKHILFVELSHTNQKNHENEHVKITTKCRTDTRSPLIVVIVLVLLLVLLFLT